MAKHGTVQALCGECGNVRECSASISTTDRTEPGAVQDRAMALLPCSACSVATLHAVVYGSDADDGHAALYGKEPGECGWDDESRASIASRDQRAVEVAWLLAALPGARSSADDILTDSEVHAVYCAATERLRTRHSHG